MIFIVQGLSGPFKRMFVDALIHGTTTGLAQQMLSVRGVFRGEAKKYDGIELRHYGSEAALRDAYKKGYIYENAHSESFFAIDKNQMQAAINEKRDHLVLCNEPEVIQAIRKDFPGGQIRLMHIAFDNQEMALNTICPQYEDDCNGRHDRIQTINRRIQQHAIEFDCQVRVPNTHPDDALPVLLWDALLPHLSHRYLSWQKLLSGGRRSDGRREAGHLSFGESDYSRVVGCSAFRRLQDKAQVFPLEQHDYARTRLTHSIECAMVAEHLGEAAAVVIRTFGGYCHVPDSERIQGLLKTAALLHDMGNPPFGHFGESIIRDWFRQNLRTIKIQHMGQEEDLHSILGASSDYENDLLHYEGNAQLLRLMTKLTVLEEGYGMDLTYATMAVTTKYLAHAGEINGSGERVSHKKLGCFAAERDTLAAIQAQLGLDGVRHPLTF